MINPFPGLLLTTLCCVGSLVSTPTATAAANHAQGMLGATDALMVVIDGLDEELAAHGLSRLKVEQEISSRLQAAGMQIVPESEFAAAKNAGVLTLRVRLMRAPYFFFLYNINLTLRSKLAMTPDTGAYTTIETWSDGWVGAIQPTDVGQLHGFAGELLARFLAQREDEKSRSGK